MKKILNRKQFTKNLLIGLILPGFIIACSDDKSATTSQPSATQSTSQSSKEGISVDSPTDATPEANESQKEKFQHDFAAQCVERELNNSQNQITDAEKINKACDCISAFIMEDLTDEEAKKYLSEHEHPQSLRIKYEAAAYECLQEKAKSEEPKIIKNQ